jgi:ribosome assembly protein 4
MTGHTDAVTYVQYSPDGKQLASGGGDMAIRFWNTSSLMPFHTCMVRNRKREKEREKI